MALTWTTCESYNLSLKRSLVFRHGGFRNTRTHTIEEPQPQCSSAHGWHPWFLCFLSLQAHAERRVDGNDSWRLPGGVVIPYIALASSESSIFIIFLFPCRNNWQFGVVILWLRDAVWDSMSQYVCLSLFILLSQLIHTICPWRRRFFSLVGGHSVFLWPRAGGHCLNSFCSFWWLTNTRALVPWGRARRNWETGRAGRAYSGRTHWHQSKLCAAVQLQTALEHTGGRFM